MMQAIIAAASQYALSDIVKKVVSANGGGYWDFGDKSLLFQDTAGTVPITAAGQSVARANDKSGNGKHLTQAVSGLRPVYQLDGSGRGYCDFNVAVGCCLTISSAVVPDGPISWMSAAQFPSVNGVDYRVLMRQYTAQTDYTTDGIEIYAQNASQTLQSVNRILGIPQSLPISGIKSVWSQDGNFQNNTTQLTAAAAPNASTGTGFAVGGLLGTLPGRGIYVYSLALYSGGAGVYKTLVIRKLMALAGLL
jgi:hypothetical protein